MVRAVGKFSLWCNFCLLSKSQLDCRCKAKTHQIEISLMWDIIGLDKTPAKINPKNNSDSGMSKEIKGIYYNNIFLLRLLFL